jgi:hypothetical protein
MVQFHAGKTKEDGILFRISCFLKQLVVDQSLPVILHTTDENGIQSCRFGSVIYRLPEKAFCWIECRPA